MTTPDDLPSALDPDRPYKPADDQEEIYFQGSPKIRGEVTTLLVCSAIAAVLIVVPFFFRESLAWWGWLIFVVLALATISIPILLTLSVRYRVSNYRIDYERGILSRRIDTLELWHVDDISFHQSLIDRFLGVGNIMIDSDDHSTPKLELRGIPRPRPVFEALKQRIISVKRQRGVIKMDSGE
jgi:membrane protein YdbS with pleckstrin-like domain